MSVTKNLLTFTELGNKSGPLMFLLHGWPDNSLRLYEKQIKAFEGKYRIIACNLPGYEPTALRSSLKPALPYFGYNLAEVSDMYFNTIDSFYAISGKKLDDVILEETNNAQNDNNSSSSNDKRPVLIAHDWGCVVTCALCKNHPNLARKLILLDIGAEVGKLTPLQTLMVLAYQFSIIIVFFLPSIIGDPLHQRFGKLLAAPYASESRNVFGYMYLRMYVSMLMGSLPASMKRRDRNDPFSEYARTSVCFMYATNKPFFFHSDRFVKYVENDNVGGRVHTFKGGHWFFTKDGLSDQVNENIGGFLEK